MRPAEKVRRVGGRHPGFGHLRFGSPTWGCLSLLQLRSRASGASEPSLEERGRSHEAGFLLCTFPLLPFLLPPALLSLFPEMT